MALGIYTNVTAMAANLSAYFLGINGVAPYSYSVLPAGAGGTINAVTGLYTAPAIVPVNPALLYDYIVVTDATAATAQARVLIGTPLLLFCDILQNQLNLDSQHIYLWDQKIFEPIDNGLYIAVSVMSSKPFGNKNEQVSVSGGFQSVQSINMLDRIGIDAISRGPAARDMRANILMALNSNYAESQQELNSFFVGKLPAGQQFINLSFIDGPAIPYRFHIEINMQYFVTITTPISYYDTFLDPEILVNP